MVNGIVTEFSGFHGNNVGFKEKPNAAFVRTCILDTNERQEKKCGADGSHIPMTGASSDREKGGCFYSAISSQVIFFNYYDKNDTGLERPNFEYISSHRSFVNQSFCLIGPIYE